MLARIPQIPVSWFSSARLCFSQLLLFSFFINFCMMQHLSFFFFKAMMSGLDVWMLVPHWTLISPGRCLDLFILSDLWYDVFISPLVVCNNIIIECLSVTSRYHDTKVFCSKQTLVIRRHWDLRLCLVELTLIISITTSLIIWKTALIEAKGVL